MTITSIDESSGSVTVESEEGTRTFPMASPEAFAAVSKAWLRCGWDVKYVYAFTWLGCPIIQLPEDLVRMQELIFAVKPDVLVETGVAHGGGMTFYASLFKCLGKGRVIGIELDLRPHNRKALGQSPLFPLMTLIEGSSVDPDVLAMVRQHIEPGEIVMVVLDSNHTSSHVLAELRAYAPLVTRGSYLVVCDGIIQDLAGAPRSAPDWNWNNPITAIRSFLDETNDFELAEPSFPFNESLTTERVTYWPNAHLKRIR